MMKTVIIIVASALVAVVLALVYASQGLKRSYIRDATRGLARTGKIETSMITSNDLAHLPSPVRKYLEYAGVIGKPRVYNMRVTFDVKMRERGNDWFSLTAYQHSFFDRWERFFYMDAVFKGFITRGYHRFNGEGASMVIKLLGLISVVDVRGEIMEKAETVTMFNDMCILAPATLIDKRIQWEKIDDSSVKAFFTHGSNRISARLVFNSRGQLVNFVSDDRYEIRDMKNYRFSTPLSRYQSVNGYNLATRGEAIWHYPEEEFTYGIFNIKNVEYNVREVPE